METFKQIQGMAKASRGGMEQLIGLANAMEETAGMSRELRRPLRTIQTALRNISDGQEVVDDWDRQIEGLFGEAS